MDWHDMRDGIEEEEELETDLLLSFGMEKPTANQWRLDENYNGL